MILIYSVNSPSWTARTRLTISLIATAWRKPARTSNAYTGNDFEHYTTTASVFRYAIDKCPSIQSYELLFLGRAKPRGCIDGLSIYIPFDRGVIAIPPDEATIEKPLS